MIDVRNLGCPEPVVKTKKALDAISDGIIEVLGNSESSKANIMRFAENSGFCAKLEEREGNEYLITIAKGYSCDSVNASAKCEASNKGNKNGKVLFVKSDSIGDDNDLGRNLVRGFLKTLLSTNTLPAKIIFVNRGVFLTTKSENEATIVDLLELEKRGVEIFSCGACLEFYSLVSELKVGRIGNALETLNTLLDSDGTISL